MSPKRAFLSTFETQAFCVLKKIIIKASTIPSLQSVGILYVFERSLVAFIWLKTKVL